MPDRPGLWPPQPFPPEEPEPTPDDLGTAIDWQAFSHQQLYDMVDNGLDLPGATATATGWASLGDRLDDIGADLGCALEQSAEGWQGEAAEAARHSMRELVGWTGDTATKATDVSGCVSRQADNAETARRTMPEPPIKVVHPMPRTPQPASDDGGTTAMSASPFTGGGFETAGDLITDPGPERDSRQRLHAQAAEVLGQLQRDSNEVYGTVPEFASPAGRVGILDDDPELPPGPPEQHERPEQHEPEAPRETTDTSTVGAGSSAGPAGAPGVSGPVRETLQPGAGSAASPVGSGGGAAGPLDAGARTGAGAGTTGSAAVNTPAAPSGGGGGARGGMGPAGMPIGAMGAGARGGEGGEHTTPDYLEEDNDVFSPDGSVTPPVLGADERTGNAP